MTARTVLEITYLLTCCSYSVVWRRTKGNDRQVWLLVARGVLLPPTVSQLRAEFQTDRSIVVDARTATSSPRTDSRLPPHFEATATADRFAGGRTRATGSGSCWSWLPASLPCYTAPVATGVRRVVDVEETLSTAATSPLWTTGTCSRCASRSSRRRKHRRTASVPTTDWTMGDGCLAPRWTGRTSTGNQSRRHSTTGSLVPQRWRPSSVETVRRPGWWGRRRRPTGYGRGVGRIRSECRRSWSRWRWRRRELRSEFARCAREDVARRRSVDSGTAVSRPPASLETAEPRRVREAAERERRPGSDTTSPGGPSASSSCRTTSSCHCVALLSSFVDSRSIILSDSSLSLISFLPRCIYLTSPLSK